MSNPSYATPPDPQTEPVNNNYKSFVRDDVRETQDSFSEQAANSSTYPHRSRQSLFLFSQSTTPLSHTRAHWREAMLLWCCVIVDLLPIHIQHEYFRQSETLKPKPFLTCA